MDTSGNPTVISTFAGTGGSSLGYKWAGFHELLAIDFDPHAVECFKLNFPDVPVWLRDIKTVSGAEILDFCKIKRGDLDVFDGSPPCQGFSTAGRREVTDPRNDLFKHYVRLIEELHPKVFVMENVSGMIKGTMKGKFIEIMKTLKSLDYRVSAKLMNAKYYGVPQSRERVIFIGVRNDFMRDPVFPKPSNPIHNVVSIIPDVIGTRSDRRNPWMPLSAGVCTITKTEFDGIFKTRTGTRSATIEEIKKICSFPDNWVLIGSRSQKWARLGNAVMPKFMQAIAETIRKEILLK